MTCSPICIYRVLFQWSSLITGSYIPIGQSGVRKIIVENYNIIVERIAPTIGLVQVKAKKKKRKRRNENITC